MKYGVAFLVVGVVSGIYALRFGWWGLPLWWTAVSFLFAGTAYLYNRPEFFGKKLSGFKELLSMLLMLPY